jgi:hypothetical protein
LYGGIQPVPAKRQTSAQEIEDRISEGLSGLQ